MEKLLHMVKELKRLQVHHEDIISTTQSIEKRADKLGDAKLIEIISAIRTNSEASFNDIQEVIQGYHLKINRLDG